MPTVIATPGAVDANSYITVAEGDAYHETHLYSSEWDDATQAEKETAVIMATRLLDAIYVWYQYSYDPDQALQWPRVGLVTANQLDFLEHDEIPVQLKYATAEFARQLLESNRTSDNVVDTKGVRSFSAGPVSFTFKDQVPPQVVPDAVYDLIPSWWGYPKGSQSTRILERA